jgi:uncharacterized hydrophobic protein (TIGR00341 family)
MQLRLLQITLPHGVDWDISGLVSADDIVASWHDDSPHGHLVLQLVVPANKTEPIMEQIEKRYGSNPDFRGIILPTEGVWPRAEPDAPGPVRAVQPKRNLLGQRVSREELYADAIDSCDITASFLLLVALSSVVAAVGLTRNNVAVIIGAMVIAPLLGPNVSLAVGTTFGDIKLVGKALRTGLAGIALATIVSSLIGIATTVDPDINAIAERTEVGFADITIALAAGCAGSLAFTSGLSRAVIGVMVAVALLPPLATFGLLLGSGNGSLAVNALLLTATNLICINLAGVGTFLLQGVRPTHWREAKEAKRAIWIASLSWITLLVALIVILYFR